MPPRVAKQEFIPAQKDDGARAALHEAGLDRQVKAAIKAIKTPSPAALAKGIRASFRQQSDREWRDHIEAEATKRTLKI
ncbi:MAG: hypothetical protein ACLP19_13655 [Xanthobacteraceae bacterium]